MISKNSIEYIHVVEYKGLEVLKMKATIFPKVKTILNQVFVKNGLNKNDIVEVTSIVNNDNGDVCEKIFWSGPIDNSDETKGLSEMTSWKTKGKYISEPLNCVDLRYDQVRPSGTKDVPSETSSK